MNKREDIKQYEKLNKKSECVSRQLTEEEKIQYGLKERNSKKGMNIELQVDEQFKNLLPPLSKEEFSKLEELIVKEGCTESIKVWKDNNTDNTYIVDGHNRNDICTKHNIPFEVEFKEFSNRYEVIDWIINFQFGRRNLNPEEKYYLIGLQYENEKNSWGGNRGNQYVNLPSGVNTHLANNEEVIDGNVTDKPFQAITTAKRMGKQHGVDEKSIRDNGKYANTVDEIAELVGAEAKNNILTGEKKISKENIIEIGKQIKSGDIDKEWLKEKFIDSNEKKVKLPEKEISEKKLSIEVKPVEQNKTSIIYDQEEKKDTPTPPSNNIKEIIKDIKTPKYFAVEFNFLDELECVQDNIKQSIEMANDFLFERYDIEYNITQEEKNIALDCLNDLTNQLYELKNKLKNTKTKENM